MKLSQHSYDRDGNLQPLSLYVPLSSLYPPYPTYYPALLYLPYPTLPPASSLLEFRCLRITLRLDFRYDPFRLTFAFTEHFDC